MTKAKTAEDYKADLEVAKAELKSVESKDAPAERKHQLDDALQWVDLNYHDLTPEQADQIIDLIAGFQAKNFSDALAWNTLPRYR